MVVLLNIYSVSVVTTVARRCSLFLRTSVLGNKQGDTSKSMNDHRVGADVVSPLNNAAVQAESMAKHLLYMYVQKVKCNQCDDSCFSAHKGMGCTRVFETVLQFQVVLHW